MSTILVLIGDFAHQMRAKIFRGNAGRIFGAADRPRFVKLPDS